MHCIRCGEEITGTDIIVHCSENIDEHMCEECAKKLLYEQWATVFKWEYYKCWHPDVVRCDICSNLVHRTAYRAQHWYCLKCAVERWNTDDNFFCPQCWVYHTYW